MPVTLPTFVDHHTHLLRTSARAPQPCAPPSRPGGEPLADYHRRLAREGSSPTDDIRPSETADIGDATLDERLWDGLVWARSLGLGMVAEAGMPDWGYLDSLLRLASRPDGLPVAVRLFVSSGLARSTGADGVVARRTGRPDVEVVGVKCYADGWLGPRTCALCAPFADVSPADDGVLFLDGPTLAARADAFVAAGLTIATHAIGDRAVSSVLDGYAALWGDDAAAIRAAAPRIEHAQVLSPELVARMAELGVVACIQPSFATSDAEAAVAGLGAERAAISYDWQGLLAHGVRVLTGADYPIETLSPLQGLVDLASGPGRSRLPVDQAFALMTDATYGTMTLSADPRTVPLHEVAAIEVLAEAR